MASEYLEGDESCFGSLQVLSRRRRFFLPPFGGAKGRASDVYAQLPQRIKWAEELLEMSEYYPLYEGTLRECASP